VDSLALHVGFSTLYPTYRLGSKACNFAFLIELLGYFLCEQEMIICFFSLKLNKTGFDVDETSLDGHADIEGLDASAAHVANLLSSEPSDGTS